MKHFDQLKKHTFAVCLPATVVVVLLLIATTTNTQQIINFIDESIALLFSVVKALKPFAFPAVISLIIIAPILVATYLTTGQNKAPNVFDLLIYILLLFALCTASKDHPKLAFYTSALLTFSIALAIYRILLEVTNAETSDTKAAKTQILLATPALALTYLSFSAIGDAVIVLLEQMDTLSFDDYVLTHLEVPLNQSKIIALACCATCFSLAPPTLIKAATEYKSDKYHGQEFWKIEDLKNIIHVHAFTYAPALLVPIFYGLLKLFHEDKTELVLTHVAFQANTIYISFIVGIFMLAFCVTWHANKTLRTIEAESVKKDGE